MILVTALQANMSSVQAITATIGVIIAFIIYKIETKNLENKN